MRPPSRLAKQLPLTILLVCAVVDRAQAQCLGAATGGGGGPIPSSGTGNGTFPSTLPSSPLTSTLAVISLPPGATTLDSVVLRGLNHSWIGDLQFVLTDPAGSQHNLMCRLGPPPGGFSCDFAGDYTLTSACGCVPPMPLPATCTGATVLPPGAYSQHFGSWPSGTHVIWNTPINSIPIGTGTWVLTVYDWAGGDVGSLASWDLVFSATPGGIPPPPTCAGTVSIGEGPHQEIVSSPVTLQWTAAPCATTRRSRVRRTPSNPSESWNTSWDSATPPSNGWSTTEPSLTESAPYTLDPGEYEWQADSGNSDGFSTGNPTCTFCIPGRICLTPNPTGLNIPQPGAINGVWPTQLPTSPMVSSASVTVPPGATQLVAVKLQGLTHTWIGDLQLVLVDPTGGRHSLLQLNDGVFGGGCANGISGDYAIVDKVLGLVTCSGYESSFVCGAFAPGEYYQYHAAWPSGAAGIFNTPLTAIPISNGTWSLEIYDWNVGFDNGSLASWSLCFDAGPAGPTTYCTAGTSTNGCNASISASAQPSVTLANPCQIDVANLEGQKSGLIFYSITGAQAMTWSATSTSFLCVKSPTQRSAPQSSGGTAGACDGSLTLDWSAFQAANPGSLGNPWAVGDKAYVQGWFRDPAAPKTTNLSDALELTYAP